jgi:hypothetical protein
MAQLFNNTVSALCYSIIDHRCYHNHENTDFPHNRIVQFVLQQYQRMPDYLKLPIFILTILFNIWGFFRKGCLFHRQLDKVRWQQIEAWKQSQFSIFQDLIRFYESLVIFCWQAERYE